jgi:HEAT repeat protein
VRLARLVAPLALAWLAACGPRSAPVAEPHPKVPRLLAPPQIDPDARGAAYLTTVALALQPAWHQFLEDCRLRLPASHPLNRMDLVTTAHLVIGRRGELVELRVVGSGSVDFDHAIEQVVKDASPLPPPPHALWSDDDQLHLAWTFARDRRQAGPATAKIVDVELPLRAVVDRRIGQHDLTRAAQRILRAKPSSDRELATQRVMIAALREALESSDTAVRRFAVEAVGRARATELAMEVAQLLTPASDVELRVAAIATTAALGNNEDAIAELFKLLEHREHVSSALLRAALTRGTPKRVKPVLLRQLRGSGPKLVALELLAWSPVPEAEPLFAGWMRARNPGTRARACTALAGYRSALALPLIERGLRDRDASVRATCLQAVVADGHRGNLQKPIEQRIIELTRDRDSVVRANAVSALGLVQPSQLAQFAGDPASEVRAACARAIGVAATGTHDSELRSLIQDRDPDVRAAAWTVVAAMASPPSDRAALATDAAVDPAPQVRLAAIRAIDDERLGRLAKSDDDRDVRTEALVELGRRRGRAGIADLLLERLGAATPGSAERVRTALAWLLAQ